MATGLGALIPGTGVSVQTEAPAFSADPGQAGSQPAVATDSTAGPSAAVVAVSPPGPVSPLAPRWAAPSKTPAAPVVAAAAGRCAAHAGHSGGGEAQALPPAARAEGTGQGPPWRRQPRLSTRSAVTLPLLPELLRRGVLQAGAGGGARSGLRRTCSEPCFESFKTQYACVPSPAFLARQRGLVHENRRQLSKQQKMFVAHARAATEVESLGCKGLEGFKTLLTRRFGSVLAGWWALDSTRKGVLSFHEFCNACRVIGYQGHLKSLWEELDVNKSGQISLMEVDSHVGHWVGRFKLLMTKKYGDMFTAWCTGIDKNGHGRIEEDELVEACQDIGLQISGRELFAMFIAGPKEHGLSLAQIDHDAWVKLQTCKRRPGQGLAQGMASAAAERLAQAKSPASDAGPRGGGLPSLASTARQRSGGCEVQPSNPSAEPKSRTGCWMP